MPVTQRNLKKSKGAVRKSTQNFRGPMNPKKFKEPYRKLMNLKEPRGALKNLKEF